MVCCLTAPSHHLNQCWLTISQVQWHSSECNFTRDTSAVCHWNKLEKYLSKIVFKSPRVNELISNTNCTKKVYHLYPLFYHENSLEEPSKCCETHPRSTYSRIQQHHFCLEYSTASTNVKIYRSCFELIKVIPYLVIVDWMSIVWCLLWVFCRVDLVIMQGSFWVWTSLLAEPMPRMILVMPPHCIYYGQERKTNTLDPRCHVAASYLKGC